MFLDQLDALVFPVALVHFFKIPHALVIHQSLQQVIPETLHQIELELEHTDGSVNERLLIHALAQLILSDLAYLPQILLEEAEAAVKGHQLECPVNRVLDLRGSCIGTVLEIVHVKVGLSSRAVTLVVDLHLAAIGRNHREGMEC